MAASTRRRTTASSASDSGKTTGWSRGASFSNALRFDLRAGPARRRAFRTSWWPDRDSARPTISSPLRQDGPGRGDSRPRGNAPREDRRRWRSAQSRDAAAAGRLLLFVDVPRMRRNSPHDAGAARGSTALRTLRAVLRLAIRLPATSASQAASSAWIASDGGMRLGRHLFGNSNRLLVLAPPNCQLDSQHTQRPLVPANRRSASGAPTHRLPAADIHPRACTTRASGESARGCRRRRRSSRGTGPDFALRGRASAFLRRSRSPSCTRICPSVASATASPWPDPSDSWSVSCARPSTAHGRTMSASSASWPGCG